ncbi:hypothetical protein JKP88DRAFT_142040, partial [Tribonema minus]
TAGHMSLLEKDHAAALKAGSNLQYGELLPGGTARALDAAILHAADASTKLELGSGTGKSALQAFLQYTNLAAVVGVELAPSRHALAEAAALRLAAAHPGRFRVAEHVPGQRITLAEHQLGRGASGQPRLLVLRTGNLLDMPTAELRAAQAVMLQVCLPESLWPQLHACLLSRLCPGARLLSYNSPVDMWHARSAQRCALRAMQTAMLSTSWAPVKGHPFY